MVDLLRPGGLMGRRTAAQMPLTLRVLGGVCIERDGERLELPPSKKTRALLGYLLVEPREHTREHLCGMFWDLPDDPRGALRWSLSRLRPLIDEPGRMRIRADRERVQIDAAGAVVDLHEVAKLRAQGQLREAAALFRGELLEGLELCEAFRFQAWCTARREEARRLHAEVLRDLAGTLEGEEAVQVWRKLVELEPADEAAHRRVMSLLGKLGRPREAIAQYDACREILRSVLGTSPSQETEQVRRSLGAGTLAAAPPAQPRFTGPANLPIAGSPLIGRDAECAALLDRLAAPGASLVLGEPGIGKSRLLEEVARRAGREVLVGRSYEAEQGRPYGCIIEALRASGLAAQAGEVLRRDLGALLSELAPAPEGLDRARLFDAVAALLRDRGAVLVLDDVQWMDEASASLTHYLVRTASVRAVLAAREGELADNAAVLRLLRALRRGRALTEVPLRPLDAAAIADLLTTRGLPAGAARDSTGNPLLALEMGRALAEGRPPLSGGLAEALDQRLEALDEASQSLLSWTAALGRAVRPALLAAVTGRAEAEVIETLAVLERRGVARLHSDGTVDFAHDLLREAAYRRIPAARRRLLHATLARSLWEAGDSALAGTVARQAALGGEDALGVRASVAAAEQAMRVFAAQEALSLALQALPLLPALPRPERLRAHLSLLTVCVYADRRPVRLELVAQELSLLVLEAEASGLDDVVSDGFQVLSQAHYFRQDDQEALRGSLRGAEAARSNPDPSVRARALAQAGRCLAQLERDVDQAARMLDEAASAAQSARVPLLDISLGRGLVCIFRGDDAAARDHLNAAVRGGRDAGDPWRETESLFALCRLSLEARDANEAMRAAEAVLPVAEKMPEGDEPAFAHALLALARMLDAQLRGVSDAGARDEFRAAAGRLRDNEGKFRMAQLLLLRGDLDLAAGRLADAAAAAAEVRGLGGEVSREFRNNRAHILEAELALARGDAAAARAQLARALAAPGSLGARQRARIAAAAARAGFTGGDNAALHRGT